MRKLMMLAMALSAAGIAMAASSGPVAAREYPWCIQGGDWGYPGECSYETYEQCAATASGRFVYCGPNPVFAFGARRSRPASPSPYPAPAPYHR